MASSHAQSEGTGLSLPVRPHPGQIPTAMAQTTLVHQVKMDFGTGATQVAETFWKRTQKA